MIFSIKILLDKCRFLDTLNFYLKKMDGIGANADVPDIFAASPFSEPYPLSRQEIVAVQPSVPWSDNLDYILSGLVRKYVFDFYRVSRSLKKYVEVILCETDDENLDPDHYTEEACRLRWSFLDFEEFQRRKQLATEVFTMRTILAPRIHKSTSPPVSDIEKIPAGIGEQFFVSTTLKKTAEEAEEGNQSLVSHSHGPTISFHGEIVVDDKKKPSHSPHNSDSVSRASCLSDITIDSSEETVKSSKHTAASIKHQNFLITSEESDMGAWSFDDQTELTPQPKPALDPVYPNPRPSPSVTSPQNHSPRHLSELERSVLDEGLEISNFTIFSHNLKTQFEGFYNEVRGALPAMRDSVSSSSDEDDEDEVVPVFSNLRVDEKTGEYVGHIAGLAQINAAATPSAGAASKASSSTSLIQAAVSETAAVFDWKQVAPHEPKPQAGMSSQRPTNAPSQPVRVEKFKELDIAPVLKSAEDSAVAADWCRERTEGQLCAGRGDHVGAVAHLSRAISSAEANSAAGVETLAEMWQERAESLMAIQHYAEAAEDWQRLILAIEREGVGAVTVNAAKARLQLAISLRFTGKYVDAAHEVDIVLQVEPENQMAR
jgi:tetratricopeptide (TPR) repeat protein